MKSVGLLFRNLVLLIIVMLWGRVRRQHVNHCHVVGASAKTARNISLVRKVGLEDVCRVGLDAVEEVIVG